MTEILPSVSLTLWDSDGVPPDHLELVCRWNGYAEKGSVHSLLRYVDKHDERLRRKYLAWVHELGEGRVNGKRLIDHLAFEDGLSYWWMTLFVEKSPWKSPSIIDSIRLLALEEIVVQKRPGKLRLVSASRDLHEVLSDLCQNLGITYEWVRIPAHTLGSFSLQRIVRALPESVQALVTLIRHLCVRWPLRHSQKSGWFGGDGSLFFCSYFDNVDPKAAKQGVFHSYYWEGLHALLHRFGSRSNWLQLFIPCAAVPTPLAAMSWVKGFNQQHPEQGFHSFLDAYLSWRIVLHVLKRWLGLALISRRLGEIKHAFRPQGSQLSLWPLMRKDWHDSIHGPVSIDNLFWMELFHAALNDIPHQKKGFYLYENQAWERALIHAWRKNGHGRLTAVAHSTVRFWDLRYFTEPRTIRSPDPYSMPQADLVALNGKAAIDAYLSVGYPQETIVECEALRYGFLNDLRTGRRSGETKGNPVSVLILGDFLPSGTIKMLQLLEAAVPHLSVPVTYTVKPHPNYPVKSEDYPSLHLNVVIDPLEKILRDFDIVYSGGITSAALDVFLAGLPVVAILDETKLNFSPLRGQPGTRFVSTPEELAEALMTVRQYHPRPDVNNFFFLDPELPKWSRLLAN